MKNSLEVFEFGETLLDTNDLDPVYVLLWEASFSHGKLCRWLVAYWCFYHCGTASWLSEHKGRHFWRAMKKAAGSKEFPRGTERRHFRGQQALRSVDELTCLGKTCSKLVDSLKGGRLLQVMNQVKQWRGFGNWIAFKVADMLERLDLAPVRFVPSDIFSMFESPRKGAEDVFSRYAPDDKTGDVYEWAYQYLQSRFRHDKAPPQYERHVNIQEIETILCKWHSHLGGHYPPGKDLKEIKEGLKNHCACSTSRHLLEVGRESGLWT